MVNQDDMNPQYQSDLDLCQTQKSTLAGRCWRCKSASYGEKRLGSHAKSVAVAEAWRMAGESQSTARNPAGGFESTPQHAQDSFSLMQILLARQAHLSQHLQHFTGCSDLGFIASCAHA